MKDIMPAKDMLTYGRYTYIWLMAKLRPKPAPRPTIAAMNTAIPIDSLVLLVSSLSEIMHIPNATQARIDPVHTEIIVLFW